MTEPLNAAAFCYSGLVGIGGIGAGSFFELNGDETLGREESRSGHFIDRRDYCKLHIIAHYVATLLGPKFPVVPIGRVGDDGVGRRLYGEMQATGLVMRRVEIASGEPTLFSFCFVYPDGSGGNMTTDDSACSRVDAGFVNGAEEEFERLAGQGIALCAPEVPLEGRAQFLRTATRHRLFRAASFTSEEMPRALADGLVAQVDLLGINRDEAAAVLGREGEGVPSTELAAQAVDRLSQENPLLQVLTTAGGEGSWSWDGSELRYLPCLDVSVESTAGAGDAHFGAAIAGLAAGLPLADAHHLAALVASFSVTSRHTIAPGADRDALRELARQKGAKLPASVLALLAA